MTSAPIIQPKGEKFTDPLEYEEDAEYALRVHLGLRPIVYKNYDAEADPAPCPSWCWIAQQPAGGDDAHEVEWDRPFSATHTMDATPAIAGSLYWGWRGDCGTQPVATIEPRLQQRGQNDPTIRIAVRSGDDEGRMVYADDRLRLSIDDAKDLVTALQYLLEVAEADPRSRERNAFEIGRDFERGRGRRPVSED